MGQQPAVADDATRARVESFLAGRGVDPWDSGETVTARVNYGRWVADCPAQGCAGAELAHPQRGLLCGSCGAQATIRWPRQGGGA